MDLLLPVHFSLSPSPSYSIKLKNTQAGLLVHSKLNHHHKNCLSTAYLALSNSSLITSSGHVFSSSSSTATITTPKVSLHHWIVVMDKLPSELCTQSDIIDYYVKTLARVLGSEKDAQMCIYNASWESQFGFCCNIDEDTSRELASIPGVLSVRPDTDFENPKKDYSHTSDLSSKLYQHSHKDLQTSSEKNTQYWLVRMQKPGVEVVTKAQMVDYYAQTLMKVLGNEKDAQVCIYHISWQNSLGFCCVLDHECAEDLVGVPGVLSVQPDVNFKSEYKDYGGDTNLSKMTSSSESLDTNQTPHIKTKRLFVTGLSFYTSEKTLRAAFEVFGELVEVKIIMDKISKRSKGYAFIEYTTEEAASQALKEMNGKIINGWMIVVDVAKVNPPRYRPRPTV